MDRVVIVVLAAGASERFGSAKQAARIGGASFTEIALHTALAAGTDSVILVTGAHADATLTALDTLSAEERVRVRVVHNYEWQRGQASSLHVAVRAFDASTGAVIFMPVDQPFLESALLVELIARWRAGADLVAARANGEVRGAPALFDRRYFGELLAVTGDRGGRVVLQRHHAKVEIVEVDAAQLTDIDRPDQLHVKTDSH